MSWKVDNAHTSLEFSARHMMVSTVKGHFRDFTGEVELDPSDLTRSTARAEIQATSLDTREERRDAHLRSADFFDVEKFPVISYQSGKIESRATTASGSRVSSPSRASLVRLSWTLSSWGCRPAPTASRSRASKQAAA